MRGSLDNSGIDIELTMNDLTVALIVILATGAAVGFVNLMLRRTPRKHGYGKMYGSLDQSPERDDSNQQTNP